MLELGRPKPHQGYGVEKRNIQLLQYVDILFQESFGIPYDIHRVVNEVRVPRDPFHSPNHRQARAHAAHVFENCILTIRKASRPAWMSARVEVPNVTVVLCPRKDRATASPVVPTRVTLCSSGTAATTFGTVERSGWNKLSNE